MKIFSPDQIRHIEQATFQHKSQPISYLELMEEAGIEFADSFQLNYPPEDRVIIFCGSGNNGGDGLVVARQLAQEEYDVTVVLLEIGQPTEGRKTNLKQLPKHKKVEVIKINKNDDLQVLEDLLKGPNNQVIIDAIFGIGLNRPITGYWAKVIELINRQPFQIVAIDIPSGMYANQPTEGTAIKATQTYTFHSPKLNFFFPENEEFVGNWVVLPIPLDEETCRKTPTDYQLIADDILPEIPKRKIFSHKGTYGHALLIGGQYGMAGAALLATRAALRSGCGKVTVLTPSCNQVILQLGAPEALLLPTASERHLSAMTIFTGIYSAIGIGPGLGKHADTVQLMHKLCKANASFVFDADAINILSENPDLLQILPQGSILTPHPKEFERLAGSWNNSIERLQKQIAFSKSHQVYVIFKNAKTTITTPSGKVFFNNTGSPGMAKGGTGDILTGYLTGLLARGLSGLDACLRAVYTHGRAGNLAAADSRSTESMKAGDLLDFL